MEPTMKHVILAIIILFCGSSAFATFYPARLDSNTDILVVPDAEDDLYLKHHILDSAKQSIEMISHVQTMGPVGGLVVDDLRKAMARGVKVKYLFEAIATMTGGGEIGLDSIPFLTEDQLYRTTQSELIVNRITQRLNSPFAINDLVHKKILIVDRGTPNEIIMITGRNNHEVNFKWSDLTFIIRRVNSNQSYLGDDIINDFDKTWATSRKYFKVEEPTILSGKDKERYAKIGFQSLRPTPIGREIYGLLKMEPKLGETLASYQFRPENVRVITTDTLDQIVKMNLKKTLGLRSEIVDDVNDFLAELIVRASKVEANIYAILIPPKIRKALVSLAERNGEITILTNSSESLGSALPIKIVTDALASYGPELLEELSVKSGVRAAEKIKMFAMTPSADSSIKNGLTATHRKMWVLEFPNGRKLSFFGSHNITTASSSKSDEIMIAAIDNRMADYFTALNRRDIMTQYKQVTIEDAKSEKASKNVTRQMGHGLFQTIY